MSIFSGHTFKKSFASKISLFVGTGTLLIVSGLGILFAQILLSEPQDIRRSALVADGTGELQFEPAPGSTLESSSSRKISIKLDPNQLPYSKVKLKFDVVTNDVIDELAPTFNQGTGLDLSELQLHKVDHGYTVTFSATRQNATQAPADSLVTLLDLRFKAKKDGQISLSFNPEQTVMIGTSDNQDELKLFETFSYTIKKDAIPGDGADPDDLFFDPINNDTTKFTFRTVDTNTEIAPSQMVPNRTYKVTHTSYVQNLKKSQDAEDRTVTVQLKINGTQQTQGVLSYKSLASKNNGDTTTVEGTFTAQEVNKLVVTLDPTNTIRERAEDNNSWEKEVRIGGSSTSQTGGISIKQCNETCSSNSECSTNQRCFNTGTEKRCRLATNVASESCSGLPNQGLSRSCNQYCADSRECGAGYTCWYNRCRIPNNVESTSCAVPQTTTTTTGTTKGGLSTTTLTFQGCNLQCASNRECQAGLRCYQGACRHPLNPRDLACSPDQTAVGATPVATASPRPSASPATSPRPTATPSGSPTPPQLLASPTATTAAVATPQPTPEPTNVPLPPATANESMLDSLALLINSYITNLSNTPQFMGIPIPFLIIGAGLLFLIIAILIFIFSRRSPKIAEAPKTPAPASSAIHPPSGPQTIHQNPEPPKEVLARRETQQPTMTRPVPAAPVAQPTSTAPTPVATPPRPMSVSSTQSTAIPAVQPAVGQQITRPQPAAPSHPAYQPPIQRAQPQVPSATPTPAPRPVAMPSILQSQPVMPAQNPPAVIEQAPAPTVLTPAQPPAVMASQTPAVATPSQLPTTPRTEEKLSMADRLKQKGVTMDSQK